MKTRYALVLAALLATASAAFAATGFQGTLSGLNEVGPNASPGTGTATVILNDAGTEIAYNVSYSGLVGTVTAAHIHKAPVGVNGGVVIGFSPPVGTTAGSFNGTAPMTALMVADLMAGLYYVNIHTTSYAGGEVRAQLEGAPTPAGKTTWGRIKKLYR